jgi:hypothetical protein
MEFYGIRRWVELSGTYPDLRVNGWAISKHALGRAVDMAMPYEDIIDVLSDPTALEWHTETHGKDRALRVSGKWAAVLDKVNRYVVTLLPHTETDYDRSTVYETNGKFTDLPLNDLLVKIQMTRGN